MRKYLIERGKPYVIAGFLTLVVSLILAGLVNADSVVKLHSFNDVITQLEEKVLQEDWGEAQFLGNSLKKLYDKQLWKLQLLGDESEYEQLENDIHHLIVLLKEKDKKESLVRLTLIQTELKHIFSL